MANRFPKSGANATAILPATASSNQQILGITSGRVFWLRGLSMSNNATTGPLSIKDATVGSTATTPVITIPLVVGSASSPANGNVFTFSAPGVKFATGVVGMLDASGSVPIGNITAWGYEE